MDNYKIESIARKVRDLMIDEKENSVEYKDDSYYCGYHTGKYLAYEMVLELLLKELRMVK